MGPKNQFYLLDLFNQIALNEDAELWLGRVVQNYAQPIQGYAPTKKDIQSYSYRGPYEVIDFSTFLDSAKSAAVRSKLMNFFEGNLEVADSVSRKVSTKKVWRYALEDVDGVFKKVIANEEVAGKLRDWLSLFGRQAYMMTGFLIAENVKFEESQRSVKKETLNVDPGAAVTAAVGAPGLESLSLSGGIDGSKEKGTVMEATSVTKSIFAVEYRSIRKVFWAKKGNDTQLGFGPQGPKAFGEEEEGERIGETTTTGFEIDRDSVEHMLEDLGANGVELEEHGDFSIVIEADDDGDEEDEDEDEDEEEPEE